MTGRPTSAIVVTAMLLTLAGQFPAVARGGIRPEDPWSPTHIAQLPPEIRVDVKHATSGCEAPIAALHLLSRRIHDRTSGERFIAIHFDELWCANRPAICTRTGCLHQVYVSSNSKYRRVWSGYAREIELKHFGDHAAIEITCDHSAGECSRLLRWDGKRFRLAK